MVLVDTPWKDMGTGYAHNFKLRTNLKMIKQSCFLKFLVAAMAGVVVFMSKYAHVITFESILFFMFPT